MPRPPVHVPRHRRGVTRAALVTAVVVLASVTAVQVLGSARFAEEALSGHAPSWALAAIALLGGGLGAALTIVAFQATVSDLRTRPARSRQDASRDQLDDPEPRTSARVPGQREAGAGPTGSPSPRGRRGVHRAGGG